MTPPVLPWKVINQRHPDYRASYWRRCRALKDGGNTLLGDESVMEEVLPPFASESDDVYRDRLARASYANHAGTVCEGLLAGLFADPLTFAPSGLPDGAYAALGDFWARFQDNTASPGGPRKPLNELLRELVDTAFSCEGRAYVGLHFPVALPPTASLGDQIRTRALDLAAYPVSPECITNWADGPDGELAWCVVKSTIPKDPSPFTEPGAVVERFTIFTATGWTRYEALRQDARTDPAEVVRAGSGEHGFGRVPILRLTLSRAVRVMDRLESLARAHLNATNALARASLRSLLPQLYEFLADNPEAGEGKPNEAVRSYLRPVEQTRGPGYVQVRQEKDRAVFVGPDSAPFEMSLKICESIEKSIYAVTHSMALNSDPKSAAAIGRSGESKAQDRAATAIVLRALGQQVRAFVADMLGVIARARGDADATFELKGLEHFDQMGVADALDEAMSVAAVGIDSATMKTEYHTHLAELVLGERATPEVMAKVRQELETASAHVVQPDPEP